MNIIDIEKDYKKAIEKIWDKDEYEKSRWNKGNYEDFRTIYNNGYAVPKSVRKNALLFIGINPSIGHGETRHFYDNDKDANISKSLKPYLKK